MLCSYVCFPQAPDRFEVTPDGTNSIVVQMPGQTSAELFAKAKLYIAKTYKNPDRIINAEIPGQMLRYEGYEYFTTGIWSDGRYEFVCDLEFKDGRYKISYTDLSSSATPVGGIRDIFNKKGEVRKMEYCRKRKENYEALMQNNHQGLKSFVEGAGEKW